MKLLKSPAVLRHVEVRRRISEDGDDESHTYIPREGVVVPRHHPGDTTSPPLVTPDHHPGGATPPDSLTYSLTDSPIDSTCSYEHQAPPDVSKRKTPKEEREASLPTKEPLGQPLRDLSPPLVPEDRPPTGNGGGVPFARPKSETNGNGGDYSASPSLVPGEGDVPRNDDHEWPADALDCEGHDAPSAGNGHDRLADMSPGPLRDLLRRLQKGVARREAITAMSNG